MNGLQPLVNGKQLKIYINLLQNLLSMVVLRSNYKVNIRFAGFYEMLNQATVEAQSWGHCGIYFCDHCSEKPS